MSTSKGKQNSLDSTEAKIDLTPIYTQVGDHTTFHRENEADLQKKTKDWNKIIWCYAKIAASLGAHVGFFACLGTIIWTRRATTDNSDSSMTKRLYHYYLIASSVAGFLYIVMMVEAAACDTYRALLSFTAKQSVQEYIELIREERPRLKWHARSYHFEVRTQTRLQRDAKGQVNVRQLRQKQKVITHRKTETVQYKRWSDATCDMKSYNDRTVLKVECSKTFSFKNKETKDRYYEKYRNFCASYKDKDDFTEYEEDFHIPGYKESFMACVGTHGAPCWLSEVWFWILTMLLLTWPYRWLFCTRIPRQKVVFIKELEL